MLRIKASFLVIVLTLTGCAATHNYYMEPKNLSEKSGTATIVPGFFPKRAIYSCKRKSAVLSSVDDQKIKYSLLTGGNTKSVSIMPGKHDLVIFSTYSAGCTKGVQDGLVSLTMTLEPNTTYNLNTDAKDGSIFAWVEDEKGNRVSEVGTAPAGNYLKEHYVPPPKNDTQAVAKIQNYLSKTFSNYRTAFVQSIDGKEVRYGEFGDVGSHSILLTSGSHQLVIESEYQNGALGLPVETYGFMQVNLLRGTTYQLKMWLGDSYVLNWIEDKNGKKVTPVMKFPT